MMNHSSVCAFSAGLLLSLAAATTAFAHDQETAYGEPDDAAKVSRTIALNASDDMRFSKSNISVRQGETIRFVISNVGKVRHEFNLGTRQELEEHRAHMKKFPDMVHEDANLVTVEPGQKGEVIWTFSKAGVVDFACLYPGHFEAGMKGQVRVAKAS